VSAAHAYPPVCPRCKGAILWCDGEPAPDLIFVVDSGARRIVGCTRCVGRKRAPAEPPRTNSILGTPPRAPDPRPIRQILHEEGAKVVELLGEGLDVVDKVASLWSKLKKPKP
jgi:hypothetical protein